MIKSLIAPLVFQLVFFALMLLEFVIPSAGILTVLAILSLVTSWWLVIASDVSWLFSVVLVSDLILIPLTLFYGFRFMQRSPLANRSELSSHDGFHTQVDLSSGLLGKEGVAQSMLKPWGKVEVEGEVYDATSTGPYLESGTSVTVVAVQQNKLTVEPKRSQGE